MKYVLYVLLVVSGLVVGWVAGGEKARQSSVPLLGVKAAAANTGYTYELTTFECNPLLLNGSCSKQLETYYNYLISDNNARCAERISRAQAQKIPVPMPVFQAPVFSRQKDSVVCKWSVLDQGIKCSPSY